MKKPIIIAAVIIVVIIGAVLVVMYQIGDRVLDEIITAELESITSEINNVAVGDTDSQVSKDTDSGGADMPGNAGTADSGNRSSDNTQGTADGTENKAGSAEEAAGGNVASDKKGVVNNNTDTGKNATVGSDRQNYNIKDTENAQSSSSTGSGQTGNAGIAQEPYVNPAATHKAEEQKTKVTAEKIEEIKNQVTFSDKMEAAAMLLKRLTASDIEQLKVIIQGGLTKEEEARAKQLVYERFTKEEVNKIKEMYRKYMYGMN